MTLSHSMGIDLYDMSYRVFKNALYDTPNHVIYGSFNNIVKHDIDLVVIENSPL